MFVSVAFAARGFHADKVLTYLPVAGPWDSVAVHGYCHVCLLPKFGTILLEFASVYCSPAVVFLLIRIMFAEVALRDDILDVVVAKQIVTSLIRKVNDLFGVRHDGVI